MVELSIRILLAGALIFVAGSSGVVDFDIAWKAAAALVAVSVFGERLTARGLVNSGTAGGLAIIDSLLIAFVLAGSGYLNTLGCLVLAPCILASMRYGSPMIAMAPLAATAIGLGEASTHDGALSPSVLIQAAATLAIGLVMGSGRPSASAAIPEQAAAEPEDDVLMMRETYRQLRDAYQELQRKSRRDRVLAGLAIHMNSSDAMVFNEIARGIGEALSLDSVVIYTVASYGPSVALRGAWGEITDRQAVGTIEVNLREATGRIRHHIDHAISGLRDGHDHENVLLHHEGKFLGVVCLVSHAAAKREAAAEVAEQISDELAQVIHDCDGRLDTKRRLRESELLYDMAALGDAEGSRAAVASRFVREIRETLASDFASVFLLDGESLIPLAREGTDCRLIESMSFAGGPGVKGWVGIDAPELLMFDVRSDSRCPGPVALKARMGSYLAVPLRDGIETLGLVAVGRAEAGSLDLGAAETLRVAAAELGRCLSGNRQDREGVIGPNEFARLTAGVAGALIVLDPLRRPQLEQKFGRAAMAHVLRRYTRRIKGMLPAGGLVCRRAEGDFLIFIPGCTQDAADRWANEMTACASLIGLHTPDGSTRIPFAIRAKTALLDSQEGQVLEELLAQ